MTVPTLSQKQRTELHLALLDYLNSQGLTRAFDALAEETQLGQAFVADGKQRYSGLLEKKWTSVLRLNKKVSGLEEKLASIESTLPSSKPISTLSQVPVTFLPTSTTPTLILSGHRLAITSLAFHPLYNTIATGAEDASIFLFDVDSYSDSSPGLSHAVKTLKGHTKGVNCVVFQEGFGSGSLLASASSDLSIKLWDTAHPSTPCIRTLYGHNDSVSSIAFVPTAAIPGAQELLVSCSRDGTLKVWQVDTGLCLRTMDEVHSGEWVRMVAVSADGTMVASCSNDQTVAICDLSSGSILKRFMGHTHVVECVTFAPELAVKTIRNTVGGGSASNKRTSEPPMGQYLVSGSRDKTIRIWDTVSGECVMILTGHENWVRAITFHPSGTHLLSTGDDKTLRIWDLRTGGTLVQTLERVQDQFVTCLGVHTRRGVFAVGGESAKVKVFKCA
ncbi:WD40-repeat-containing domain protein [Chytriomyces sp. MP71]|nr:WD40-repeat-containing domain protein [Chytriomyces sp. MP71]